MRLVPQSLFSRLVLVLMSGLVVAQLLSLAIHAHERGLLLAQTSGMQSAQRIADIVRVLEPLSAEERLRMLSILSAPPLVISLGFTPSSAGTGDAQRGPRAAFFEAMLKHALGDEWPVSVVATDATPYRGAGSMHGYAGPAGMHGGWPAMDRSAHMFSQPGLAFHARVRLHDGTLVTFDSHQPPETLSWPHRVLGSLAILLVTVIVLSLIAVRWATRPLDTLAVAAEALGRNIERPPLPETGPLEVRRAARAFNTMQARLASYLRDRTRILAAMSHDLKTPITRLRLRAELLDDPQLRSKFGKDLEEMEHMVGHTLDFMRGLESDEPAQPLDVEALVRSLQADMQETGGIVEVEGAALEPYIGKPGALKRCLANLLDNAVKYGKSAHVTIQDSDRQLVFRVCDEGPGLPDTALERVFEPFYRLDASRSRDTGGTGLGLSIARSIAVSHGGTLTLSNRPQGGLEATLALPR